MWRSPEEDDEEEHDCLPPAVRLSSRSVIPDNRPADHRRHAACQTAPDDILGIAHLQKLGVDEDVEEVRQNHEEGRQPGMGKDAQPQHGDDEHYPGKNCCITLGNLGPYQRSGPRALHFLIQLVVHDVIKRVGSGSAHPTAENGRHDKPDIV